MLRRYFEVCPPELNKKTGPKPCLILSDEIIPGELLLSRAHFRFISSLQNSNTKTIFTTCQKKQPFTHSRLKQRFPYHSCLLNALPLPPTIGAIPPEADSSAVHKSAKMCLSYTPYNQQQYCNLIQRRNYSRLYRYHLLGLNT